MGRILFVDDERLIREGIAELIDWKQLSGEDLMLAEDAGKALNCLACEHFDIVITDIYMQDMSGIELAKVIKNRWPATKVILLSAYEDFGYAKEAIEAGVFRYLLKPVLPEELEETVKDALSRIQADTKLLPTEKWGETESGSKAASDCLIEKAIELIREGIHDESFNVNTIAQALHVSPAYFSRAFKKKTGITCIEYLQNSRIKLAKELLEHTELNNQEISEKAGYASVYYFNLQFKKNTGETPGKYRKRRREKDV